MRPGTLHMVMTLRDSLSVGSFIHYPFCYRRSLDAIVDEHLFGQRLTNGDKLEGHLSLFYMVRYYASIVLARVSKARRQSEDRNEPNASTSLISNWKDDNLLPDDRNLASLLAIVKFSHLLTPEQADDEVPPQWSLQYVRDRSYAQRLAGQLAEMMTDSFRKLLDQAEAAILSRINVDTVMRQRDLGVEGLKGGSPYYNSMDHEYRMTEEVPKSYLGSAKDFIDELKRIEEESEKRDKDKVLLLPYTCN